MLVRKENNRTMRKARAHLYEKKNYTCACVHMHVCLCPYRAKFRKNHSNLLMMANSKKLESGKNSEPNRNI